MASRFTKAEREAMKQRATELRESTGVKGAAKKAKDLDACIAAIDALSGADQATATRLHLIMQEEAPELDPKTWYGFPSYARDDKVVIWFQPASKFDTRYGTIGFSDQSALDDGDIWAVTYAVAEMSAAAEKKVRSLVRKAAR